MTDGGDADADVDADQPRSPSGRDDVQPRTAAAEPEPDDAVPITVNGRAVAARKGELVIAAAERAGEYIPRFCYHPRMSRSGCAGMCLVEVDTGRGPRLQPSCMITVSPDMKVDTASPTSQAGPGGHARAAARQPPARLPGLRQGR